MHSIYKVSLVFTALLAGVAAVHDVAGACSNADGTGPTVCSYLTFIGHNGNYTEHTFSIPGVAKCSDACPPDGPQSFTCTVHDCSDSNPDECGIATCP